MGIKNYNDQLAQINKAKEISNVLKRYAQQTNNIIMNLNDEWVGGDEKILFLDALGDCVELSVDLANDYDTFYRNAKKWLDEMNDLDKITKGLEDYRNYYLEPEKGDRSGTGWIKVNTDSLLSYANKIQTNNATLQEGYGMAKGLYAGIDPLITNRFTKRYSTSRMKFRYEDLKKKNKGLAGKLRDVSEVFVRADRRIEVNITGEIDSDSAIGQVTAEISSAWKAAMADGKLTKEELEALKVALSQSNILKQFKKDGNKYVLGEYAFVTKATEQILEHQYGKAAETVGEEIGEAVLDKKFGLSSVKIDIIMESLKLCFDEDGYLRQNNKKYMDMVRDSISDGNIIQIATVINGLFLQNFGKGLVDVSCKVIDGAISSVPGVGCALDYTNAVMEDLIGVSPEIWFEETTGDISNAVTKFVDSQIETAGMIDDFLHKCGDKVSDVMVQGATGIGSGVRDIGNAITSLWKG